MNEAAQQSASQQPLATSDARPIGRVARAWNVLMGLVRGTAMPPRLLRGMSWFGTAWIIAFLALLLGISVSLFSSRISESTRALFEGPLLEHRVDLPVVGFWAALVLWAVLFGFRLIAEDLNRLAGVARTLKAHDETNRAIRLAPSPQWTKSLPRRFTEIADRLQSAQAEEGAASHELIRNAIRQTLDDLAVIAAEFADPPNDASYGANIMLLGTPPYGREIIETLRFFDKSRFSPADLPTALSMECPHILYMPVDLLLANRVEASPRRVPLISLPVPKKEIYAVPGAPYAALTGRASIYMDTHELAQDCQAFDEYVRREIHEYFTRGDGRDVRSFASFQIRSNHTTVGVLNIDSNVTHVLGRNEDCYPMFLTFLTPVLRLLQDPVAKYAKLEAAAGSLPVKEVYGEPEGPEGLAQ